VIYTSVKAEEFLEKLAEAPNWAVRHDFQADVMLLHVRTGANNEIYKVDLSVLNDLEMSEFYKKITELVDSPKVAQNRM
jgi:formiminotetrahydrofolate cyclodeaminase